MVTTTSTLQQHQVIREECVPELFVGIVLNTVTHEARVFLYNRGSKSMRNVPAHLPPKISSTSSCLLEPGSGFHKRQPKE